ncbi:MAG: nucleotidyltransferase [Bacteroidetes bacterium]|nr:nucleotidyltransferase [Bacteroidota bacterium]MBU2583861.1 nucleotidyltransferase [Bacteroidota bacterium]
MNKDFKEFIQSLNDNKVKYLVVGGYAVAFHGYPRYTKDLDIWIWINESNIQKLLKAITDFGFEDLNLKAEDFLDRESVVQLGYPPNRIDLIGELIGVDFETCYENMVKITIDNVEMNFIDLENLVKNKKALGRHQDLADLENLQQL